MVKKQTAGRDNLGALAPKFAELNDDVLFGEVWADEDDGAGLPEDVPSNLPFPVGSPNDAYARYFTGRSFLAPISTSQVPCVNVTFEPGCRNSWHIHHAASGGGQQLICVGGRGWYQEWGKPAVPMTPGTCVNIPAGVKHWHGAAADSWFQHLAFEVPGEDCASEWLEPVADEEYDALEG